ncbi:unnamed protein product [Anisakis simplex]|uniref:GOLD domain-containing protein n=1 Tax=Anisakis simplex TaxID=6269 RepID=A0A0M3JYM3_ANISI|nr:unnamed protein product [Anisakis simplex]
MEITNKVKSYNTQSQQLHLHVQSPSKRLNKWYHGKDLVHFHHNATETGDYEVCATADAGLRAVRVLLTIAGMDQKLAGEYLEKTQKIDEHIKSMALSSQFRQYTIRRDTKLQDINKSYIDTFSTVQTLAMIACAFVQVFTLKRFFRTDPTKIRI